MRSCFCGSFYAILKKIILPGFFRGLYVPIIKKKKKNSLSFKDILYITIFSRLFNARIKVLLPLWLTYILRQKV